MKRLLTFAMILLLSGLLATPALAKNDKINLNKVDRVKAYEKASKHLGKRKAKREQVDKAMKQRLKLLKSNSPGNIGPIGDAG